jgi:hypothetical protein
MIWIFLLPSFLLTQCVTDNTISNIDKPIILFWCSYPDILTHMTHVASKVWVGDYEENANILHHQDAWRAQGVMALEWTGGIYYAEKDLNSIVDKWRRIYKKGAYAVQIDEFFPQSEMVNKKFIKALEMIKKEYPDRFLAVWHGSFLPEDLLTAYAKYIDLVILENYFVDQFYGWLLFSVNTERARKGGIINKTIFGLKISEAPWESQKKYLNEQIAWIRKNANEMPGIAFFAPRANQESLLGAEELAVSYFLGKSVNKK